MVRVVGCSTARSGLPPRAFAVPCDVRGWPVRRGRVGLRAGCGDSLGDGVRPVGVSWQ